MRKLLCLILLAISGCEPVPAATVKGTVNDSTLSPYTPSIVFTPLSTPQAIGNVTVWDIPHRVDLDTNGAFSVSLVGGFYWADGGPPNKRIKILVPPNDTNIYNFNFCAALATNLQTFSFTNNLGQISTRIVAGTGIVITTNNPGTINETITIRSTGGGGGSATNSYQSEKGNNLISVTTNTVTFTYTFFGVDQSNALGIASGLSAFRPTNTFITPAQQSMLSNNLNADNITSGTIPTSRLGSGTANSSTFLRGDQTYATPTGGGNVSHSGSGFNGNLAVFSDDTGTVIQSGSHSVDDLLLIGNNLSDVADAATARANIGAEAAGAGVTAATAATNADGIASGLAGYVPTNRFDINGAAISAAAAGAGVFVSLTGSDTTGNGTLASPYATISNAVSKAGSRGTIILRGGSYDGSAFPRLALTSKQFTIRNYNNERVKFWCGVMVASNSFTALSNGIYTVAPSALFTNSLLAWQGRDPTLVMHLSGALLWQSNAPYGGQLTKGGYLPPLFGGYAAETNRCEHSPIGFAFNVPSMVNSNSLWCLTNGVLYVKFAVSNVPGNIWVATTNDITGASTTPSGIGVDGDASTDVTFDGLEIYGACSAFSFNSVGKYTLRHCLIFGSGNEVYATINGDIENCEYVGIDQGVTIGSAFNGVPMPYIHVTGTYVHDTTGDNGFRIQEEVRGRVDDSYYFAGTNGIWGWISDGGTVDYYNCASWNVVNGALAAGSPWQFGDTSPVGHRTYMRLFNCSIKNTAPIGGGGYGLLDSGANNTILLDGCRFDTQGAAIFKTDATETDNFIELYDCSQGNAGQAQNDSFFLGPNTGDTTRYVTHGIGSADMNLSGSTVLGAATGDGVIASHNVRFNDQLRQFLYHSAVATIIDQNGNIGIATNAAPPAAAFFNGGMTLWNSNSTTLFLLKSGPASTAWTSTNVVLLPGPGFGQTNSVYDTNIVTSTNNWNWPGPTNNLDWARGTLQRYKPADTTPLNITNLLNFPVGQVAPVILWIDNTNLTALNVKLPSPCEATNSLGGLTVSVNASNRLQILFQWTPLSTNALFSDQQLIK